MESFAETEKRCNSLFRSLGPTFNACTPENYPVIFISEDDYRAGMCILAVCIRLFPKIRLYTFQLMSNHLHLVLSGPETDIQSCFSMFKKRLLKHFHSKGRFISLKGFDLKLNPILDLNHLRNAIAYVNRNGFVVNPGVTPFSYSWGANMFYFQPAIQKYCGRLATPFKLYELRSYLHNKSADKIKTLTQIDGLVMADSFCDISTGEAIFRSARHYFYCISRHIESYAMMAETLGENMFFTDEDLYLAARSISEKEHGINDPKCLEPYAKVAIADILSQKYRATDKQIRRILKINSE